jgi:tetratricopeptide (TPR) repeat protein
MRRVILAGIVLFTAGLSGLFAQQPAAPAAPAATPAPKPKSKGEAKAVQAIQAAGADADAVIKAAENLLNNYADTDYKEYALQMEAKAYQQKRDNDNARVYAERVLQINPKAYMMELLVAEVITPNIKKFDLNKDQEISQANHLFTDAMENAKVAVKPNAQISDADWQQGIKWSLAEAHNGLGMLALVQDKWDDAIKEFQLAVDGDPDQDAYGTRLANAYLSAGKKAEAIAVCDKLLAKPNLHPQIKAVVTNIRTVASR